LYLGRFQLSFVLVEPPQRGKRRAMADLLQILSTLLEFFAFVLLATAAVCVPVVVMLWSSELADHIRLSRRSRRRSVVPLTKIA
jgi:hypothetical protein